MYNERILIPTVVLAIMLVINMIASIHGDPSNLVINGDFEVENFYFDTFSTSAMDVTQDGRMVYILFFRVIHGGVQLLDTRVYAPNENPGGNRGLFVVHMNCGYGPGVLRSDPLITPRRGATYELSFDIADNPDGGPIDKSISVKVLVNNRLLSSSQSLFHVSAPYSTRTTIEWYRVNFTFVGTGESTTIQFESFAPGAFGALIDNVNVTLVNLVDNGSFEDISDDLVISNVSTFNVLSSPSEAITSWIVTSGKIKLAQSYLWGAATDMSQVILDLNAEGVAGTISSIPFATKPGTKYKLLFDTAANPDNTTPLEGHISASVINKQGGGILASRSIRVSGEGFSLDSSGWITYVLEFKAQETMAVVEFTSRMPGSMNGPMLDNILVYEVCKIGRYKSVRPTFSQGTAAPQPSIWISILASILVVQAFEGFI